MLPGLQRWQRLTEEGQPTSFYPDFSHQPQVGPKPPERNVPCGKHTCQSLSMPQTHSRIFVWSKAQACAAAGTRWGSSPWRHMTGSRAGLREFQETDPSPDHFHFTPTSCSWHFFFKEKFIASKCVVSIMRGSVYVYSWRFPLQTE